MHLRPFLAIPLLVLLPTSAGCRRSSPPIERDPKPPATSPEAIPDAPLSGTLAGRPFVVKSARYTVDRRQGRERIDVHLSAAEADAPCEDVGGKHQPEVWLRRLGPDKLAAETTTIRPDEPSRWEVHYEAYDEGGWSGNGRAAALFVVNEVRVDGSLQGALSACFGDASGSCVSGSFTARFCPIRIDAPVRGAPVMEPLPDAGELHAATGSKSGDSR